ncbi:Uma2 family endonuclease, partial [bacterium CPR1]|nr:Uma2 family endonuclease [bacterium CPR1]
MSLLHGRTRPITVEEFNMMAEKGILAPDERVELIEGTILLRTLPDKPHSDAISWANNLLVELFGKTHLVRVQLPLDFSPYSEPEPDFALVPKESLAGVRRHPTSADLVLEVAQTSLAYDR